jgi:hypothetical protein
MQEVRTHNFSGDNVRYITKEKSKITAELKINNAISSKETDKNMNIA